MKNLHLIIASMLFILVGCAQYDEGHAPTDDDSDDPVAECGDNVCSGDETADSCPADCDDDNTVDPPDNSGSWVCRGGVENGKDYFECNSAYIQGSPDSVEFVGECLPMNISGYWDGSRKTVQKNENGWYRLYLDGNSVTCEITYAQCGDPEKSSCWAQYGENGLSVEEAGPYRGCYPNGSCGMFFKRSPGDVPEAVGDSNP